MKTSLPIPHPTQSISSVARFFDRTTILSLCLGLMGGLLTSAPAGAASLSPDTNFRAPFFVKPVVPERALLLPDGKYLLFFDPDTLTDQPSGAITRFLADGTLDTSFNFSRIYKSVGAATPAGNGKIYVAAMRYLYGVKDAEQILRLNADGSIDSSFTPATVGGPDTYLDVRQILVQPDGKILVVGFFLTFSGNDARNGIVRLLADGTVDSSFVPVTIDDGVLYWAALQPDGKVLIGGIFTSVNDAAHPGVARLNDNGSLDSTFHAAGFTRYPTSPVRSIVVQGDGKIVLSGRFRFGTGFPTVLAPLVRLNADGSLDASFSSTSTITSLLTGRDLVLQPDGKFVAAVDNSVYRFNSDGSKDTSFRQPVMTDGTFTPAIAGTPVSVQLQSDARILVGGIFTDVDPPGAPTNSHFGVARLNSDGTIDPSLTSSHRTGVETTPNSFARLSDGSTLVGFAEQIDLAIPYNVGRLLSDGLLDPNFTLSSSDPNSFLTGGFSARGLTPLPDVTFFVFGLKANAFTYGKVLPNGTQDTAFATDAPPVFQNAIAAPEGKVLLCAGTDSQSMVYSTLTRLGTDGHLDTFAFPDSIRDTEIYRGPDGTIFQIYVGTRVLAIQPDGRILFEYLASDNFFHLVRLNSDGSIDGGFTATTFPTPDLSESFPVIFDPLKGSIYQPPDGVWTASLPLLDAQIQSDGRIIIAGHFTSFNGTAARGIIRLQSDGTVDDTFTSGGGAQWTATTETSTFFPGVENIEPQFDGKLLITGTFEAFNGAPAPGIASLNPDGSVDPSFVAPAIRDKRARGDTSFARQSDGSFLLSGPYSFPNETISPSFIRLIDSGAVGNVSTRLPVGTDDNVLIEGFIVEGPAGSSKKMMVRAIGPSLAGFGIGDALANPTLEIHDASNAIVAKNDDWKITELGGLITADQSAEIAASQLSPDNDLESAIIANLAPGSYTAVVRGVGNTIGTGVVDAYDLSPASPARLANIATRGLIQPGDKLMIAGFIVQNGPVSAVIRAIGPSLTAFGISNALADTTLQLRDQNGAILLENDDWKTTQRQELENTGLQPTHDLEAALVTTLQPGQYTAQVRGKNEATGIGVVQVYFLQ
jgi:uncharacterized delta-60 repeat protein